MANQFDWDHPFLINFHPLTAHSDQAERSKRYLSDMASIFSDTSAAQKILETENPLIYEFYELGTPERDGDLAFGMTRLHPGKVGQEYFMTKGHFHVVSDTAEVYYFLSGSGYMVMEHPNGDTKEIPVKPGDTIYVARGYAHRVVNVGSEPLTFFYVYDGIAGHDYGTIETKGFRKLVLEKDHQPAVFSNPAWSSEF